MRPGRSIAALDDSSLLEILSRVAAQDARDLANCLCVSRRWRELGCAVPQITFRFNEVSSSDELWERESTIASVLWDITQAAPGCLKALKVTLGIVTKPLQEQFEIRGEWLDYVADSVEDLDLDLEVLGNGDEESGWGPDVYTSLSSFHGLKRLKIRGFVDEDFLPQADEAAFKNLRSLHFCESYNVNPELLRAVCTACPLLQNLSVVACPHMDNVDEVVEVASASLERFVVGSGA